MFLSFHSFLIRFSRSTNQHQEDDLILMTSHVLRGKITPPPVGHVLLLLLLLLAGDSTSQHVNPAPPNQQSSLFRQSCLRFTHAALDQTAPIFNRVRHAAAQRRWLSQHVDEAHAELEGHKFVFIVGTPKSGLKEALVAVEHRENWGCVR